MSTKKRNNRKVWIVIVVVFVIQILFDPLSGIKNWSENLQARIGLPSARAKWEAQNITHYSFAIGTGIYGLCIASARVEVRDGKVVQVNHKDFLETMKVSENPMPPDRWANPYYPDEFFCDYANFTMPQLFDEVEESLGFVSSISFDTQHGFISLVRFGNPNGRGLLSGRVDHCCTGFGIHNFQVLDK